MKKLQEFVHRHPAALEFSRYGRKKANYLRASVLGTSLDPARYFINASRKIVYIVNSKAACTSIKRELLRHCGVQVPTGSGATDRVHQASHDAGLIVTSPPKGDDWTYFTFVRNPLARLVSLYFNKLARENSAWRFATMRGYLSPSSRFVDLVELVSNTPDRLSERHFKSQAYLIFDESPRCDFIGKTENFASDAESLASIVDLKDVAILNSTDPIDLAGVFDKRTFDLAVKRYHRDILEFGYEKSVAALGDRIFS